MHVFLQAIFSWNQQKITHFSSDSCECSQVRKKFSLTLNMYLLELVYRLHISLDIFQKQPV